MKTKIINISFGIIILFKLTLGFIQQSRISLDGDMSSIILPSASYEKVMHDPLGLQVALKHKSYAAPNRAFAHWMMYGYFHTVPFFMQNFTDKIDSIYASVAFAKILMQIFLLYLIASLASGIGNIFKREFLFAAVLISFLFQAADFNQYIGLIDRSITYAFFYALPMCFLLLFFHTIYFLERKGGWKNASRLEKIILILLPFIISLSGPLNPGVSLIVCPLIFIHEFFRNRKSREETQSKNKFFSAYKSIPISLRITFPVLISLSLYSWYVGQYNSENFNFSLPLGERYQRMFAIMPHFFFGNWALPVLILYVVLTFIFVRFSLATKESERLFRIGKMILIFSLLYLFLLPLGGYRGYRPTILRWDTFVPILICLYFLAAYSSLILYRQLNNKKRKLQIIWLCCFCIYFFIPDISIYKDNKYERLRLRELAASPDQIVQLKNDCTVMSWVIIKDYKDSEINCKVLNYWGVIEGKKFYFQK